MRGQRPMLFLLALRGTGAMVEQDDEEFKLVKLPNTKCLDGSPAAYYIARNDSSPSWVVWLEGGGLCQSLQDCIDRSKGTLGSSTTYAASIAAPEGMLSSVPSENPDLFSWNRIYVPYCSGDIWSGTEIEAVNPFPESSSWTGFFHGHAIIEDMYNDITRKHNAAMATNAVLTGCSAGGIGTIFNCDYFASLFPGAHVGCRPEAGWFGVPQASYPFFSSPAGPSSDPDPLHLMTSNWTYHIKPFQVNSSGGQRCAADVASGKLHIDHCEQQKMGMASCCFLPTYSYAYSNTRMFMSENTADAYQVFSQGQCPDHPDSCLASVLDHESTSYWDYIRDSISASLTQFVLSGPKRGQDGVFAPAWCAAIPTPPAHIPPAFLPPPSDRLDVRCGPGTRSLLHCMAHWQGPLTVKGKTDQQAFGDWFFGRGVDHMLLDNNTSPYDLCECAKKAGVSADDYLTCSMGGFRGTLNTRRVL